MSKLERLLILVSLSFFVVFAFKATIQLKEYQSKIEQDKQQNKAFNKQLKSIEAIHFKYIGETQDKQMRYASE